MLSNIFLNGSKGLVWSYKSSFSKHLRGFYDLFQFTSNFLYAFWLAVVFLTKFGA